MRHYPNSDLVFSKDVYPYEFMDGPEKFLLTELPRIDAFCSSLAEAWTSSAEYERAQKIWQEFCIKNMREYHELYLNLDVLLLADICENFRKTCIADYGLDPLNYYTLPGFTFDACLKFTGQELDLFTNSEMFLCIENAIRGGISVISHRHAKANNPIFPDYDLNSPHTFISYYDANNLYGGAMSERLATS